MQTNPERQAHLWTCALRGQRRPGQSAGNILVVGCIQTITCRCCMVLAFWSFNAQFRYRYVITELKSTCHHWVILALHPGIFIAFSWLWNCMKLYCIFRLKIMYIVNSERFSQAVPTIGSYEKLCNSILYKEKKPHSMWLVWNQLEMIKKFYSENTLLTKVRLLKWKGKICAKNTCLVN